MTHPQDDRPPAPVPVDPRQRPHAGLANVAEPAAIGLGFGAIAATCWLVVVGGSGLPVLLAWCGVFGGIGLVLGLLRVGGITGDT